MKTYGERCTRADAQKKAARHLRQSHTLQPVLEQCAAIATGRPYLLRVWGVYALDGTFLATISIRRDGRLNWGRYTDVSRITPDASPDAEPTGDPRAERLAHNAAWKQAAAETAARYPTISPDNADEAITFQERRAAELKAAALAAGGPR